jgi:hypothetical protein
LLAACCGWSLSDEARRRACLTAARAIAAWRATAPQTGARFAAAAGAVAFQTDAAKVHTTGGGRDLKWASFAQRPAGAPATPATGDARRLPAPTARGAFAAIAPVEEFAAAGRPWAARLRVTDTTALTILGDGAEWIWNAAAAAFPGGAQVLDIDHAWEHLGTAARGLYGEGTAAATTWHGHGRAALLADGWWGLCGHVGRTLAEGNGPERQAVLDPLTASFAGQRERLPYCQRLYAGLAIGSGLVGGAAKNLIGRRLKQPGARWLVANANRMAQVCCLSYSGDWDHYWASPN